MPIPMSIQDVALIALSSLAGFASSTPSSSASLASAAGWIPKLGVDPGGLTWFGIDRQAISDFAGSASFTIWLFAQSPQLFENYKRGSVEGLSVVFLSQWMLGDATNLIGCVLTHQLSFQIAVATYFCCIDFCIMIQFYYYWRKGRRATTAQELADGTAGLEASVGSLRTGVRKRHGSYASYQSSTYPFGVGALETSEVLPEASRMVRSSSKQSRMGWGAGSVDGLRRQSSVDRIYTPELSQANYRTLSQAAYSVAQLADQVSRRNGEEGPSDYRRLFERSTSRSSSDRSSKTLFRKKKAKRRAPADWKPVSLSPTREGRGSGSESDGDAPAHMLDSFTSTESHATSSSEAAPVEIEEIHSSQHFSSSGLADSTSNVLAELAAGEVSTARAAAPSRASSNKSSPSMEQGEDRRGRDMTRTAGRLGLLSSNSGSNSQSPAPSEATARARNQGHGSGSGTPSSTNSQSPILASQAGTTNVAESIIDSTPSNAGTGRFQPLHFDVDDSVEPIRKSNGSRPASLRGHEGDRSRSGSRQGRGSASNGGSTKRGTGVTKRGLSMLLMGLILFAAVVTGPEEARARGGVILREDRTIAGSLPKPNLRSLAKRHARNVLKKLRHPANLYLFTEVDSFRYFELDFSTDASSHVYVHSTDGNRNDSITSGLSEAEEPDDEELPPPTWERIIGRMSAWTCTVLYMTSRLPQIWANYERRSVEGLSILLFLSAFLGNLTYTISVLANPLSSGPSARDYIAESIPFLLGSGGTLIFDLTIMFQWWLWSARKAGRGDYMPIDGRDVYTPAVSDAHGALPGREQSADALRRKARELSTSSPAREARPGSRPPLHRNHSQSQSSSRDHSRTNSRSQSQTFSPSPSLSHQQALHLQSNSHSQQHHSQHHHSRTQSSAAHHHKQGRFPSEMIQSLYQPPTYGNKSKGGNHHKHSGSESRSRSRAESETKEGPPSRSGMVRSQSASNARSFSHSRAASRDQSATHSPALDQHPTFGEHRK